MKEFSAQVDHNKMTFNEIFTKVGRLEGAWLEFSLKILK